jgi:hypothetical protein
MLHSSKTMPVKRDGSQQANAREQGPSSMQIDYNTLDDLANKVEIYRGRCGRWAAKQAPAAGAGWGRTAAAAAAGLGSDCGILHTHVSRRIPPPPACRHSVVWNCVCKHTKQPLILKGYVKAKMTERNYHQVRREIRLMRQIR